MNVLSGWPNAIKALWMMSMAYVELVWLETMYFDDAHPAVITLKTLGLPDGYIYRVNAITDASNDTRQNNLNFLCGGSLEYGADNHDPTSPHDTALATEAVRGKEGNDCTNKTSYIVDSGNDALQVPVWVVKFLSKRGKANHGSQNPLVISK